MKLKYQFEMMPMGEKIVAVPIVEDGLTFTGMLRFNETGAYAFSLLKDEITYEQLVSNLCDHYQEKEEIVKEYVDDFLKPLKEAGILE